MSNKKQHPRLARTRTLLLLAGGIVVLFLLYTHHRAEVHEVIERIREGLPAPARAEEVQHSEWLDAGPAVIDPQELAGLDVERQDRSADDYERSAFGARWADVDGNSCDTRSDILARDLVDVTYEDGSHCEVSAGTLHDPYTGKTIGGDLSKTVQIDHVVSLGSAWYSGASGWSAEKRERFANDPANLVAVDASTNMSKSDDSISEWYGAWDAPSDRAQCRYAAQYVHVVATYELSVTRDDYALLKSLETSCKDRA
ncbi:MULTISPECIES: HNH endonuclease family protein [Brachybacterium]|uniref:HNH endonuclease family protein n=1 Tax=Brachybacterium kimchii TaxID=2942909 RepID=A0ABY4N7P4_9MICO|nr:MULTISPECIES: HNH endonuclease family protein [Brachybacterium]MCG7308053.1 HNH endonuclease family protein [Brachybacterium sp. ACRRE]UQN30583.1 HNH endonuclease family protein [Brachybacterium kimchii]